MGRFTQLHEMAGPVVAAIPGGGWLIECTDDTDDTWTDPILAWAIHADGTAIPLNTDSSGVTDNATHGLKSYRIYHPASTPVPDAEEGSDARAGRQDAQERPAMRAP
jgi:hypothetical protein